MNVDSEYLTGVIIPMYNCADTIIQVLDSIRVQTYVDYIKVVLLINDGSSDNTLEVVNEYTKKSELPIKIINKKNGGVSSARNYGMNMLECEYESVKWIAFCDSDDLWHEDKLQKQIDILKDNSNIDCLGSQFNNKKLKINGKIVESLVKGDVKAICIQNFPQPSTVIMKKKIYTELGGFDEKQHFAEDGNYFLRVANRYGLYYLPECLIDYGFGKRGFGESGLSGNLKGMYEGNKKNLADLRKDSIITSKFYFEMRIYYFLKYIRRIIISKYRKK